MSNTALFAAVNTLADTLAQVVEPWGQFTCFEVNALAEVLALAGRVDVATSIVLEHAYHDSGEDSHAEIGLAARAQTDTRGVKYTERAGYVLATEYVAELI